MNYQNFSIFKKIIPRRIINKFRFYQLRKKSTSKLECKTTLTIGIHITDHCNLNCVGCDHFSSIAAERFIDVKIFEQDCVCLSRLGKENIEQIKMFGGEPLLHPQLYELMSIARKYFDNSDINILTNGILLLKQTDQFWQSCKKNNVKIVITKYPIQINFRAIEQKIKKHNVNFEYYDNRRITKKMHRIPLDEKGEQNIYENYELCYKANTCIILDEGKIYTCATIPYVKYFNKFFNQHFPITDRDFVDIYKVKNMDEIFNFLCHPMAFCRYCNIKDTVYDINWRVSKKEISEWM
jgi:MoaA/NifB/PqqE/SkfB family radical SAM enzyme